MFFFTFYIYFIKNFYENQKTTVGAGAGAVLREKVKLSKACGFCVDSRDTMRNYDFTVTAAVIVLFPFELLLLKLNAP